MFLSVRTDRGRPQSSFRAMSPVASIFFSSFFTPFTFHSYSGWYNNSCSIIFYHKNWLRNSSWHQLSICILYGRVSRRRCVLASKLILASRPKNKFFRNNPLQVWVKIVNEESIEIIVNPFHVTGLFLDPLKTSEIVFCGYRKRPGMTWFNIIKIKN